MPVRYFEAEDDTQDRFPLKPFAARGANVKRCAECWMPDKTCICQRAPELELGCEFWLLTHPKERIKPTNTGRLMLMSHAESQGFIWHRKQPAPEFIEYLSRDDIQPYIVFPNDEPGYEDRTHFQVNEWDEKKGQLTKKVAFILLDATWRQARRMFRHSEYLQSLPVLSLTPEKLSEFLLRQEYSEDHLCTAEVAVNLLELVGQSEEAQKLNDFYQRFNRNYLAGRMSRPAQD